jgi:HEAT repeat protein
MTIDLTKSIVRILNPDGTTAGTGFVVNDKGLVVTCAHVMWTEEDKENRRPRPDSVEIAFGTSEASWRVMVERKWWRDPDEEDVAILRLGEPLPEGVEPLPLGSSQHSKNHDFCSWGHRHPEDFPRGLASEGKIQGRTAYGKQEAIQLLTNQIDEGMSGAPVWDVQGCCVVGMVNAFWKTQRHQDAWLAFAIPSETLKAVCPDLELLPSPAIPQPHRLLEPGEVRRLGSKLVELENAVALMLQQFRESKLAIHYPQRKADKDLRRRLVRLPASQSAFWTLIGEAGLGKTTLMLRLVEWCQKRGNFYPIWLDPDLFYGGGEKLSRFFLCRPEEVGFRLQQLAGLVQKRLVLFADALDVIVSRADSSQLVSQLNELASNAVLICSSRPSAYEQLKDVGTLRDIPIPLAGLSPSQVMGVLRQVHRKYHVQVGTLAPDLLEMCQNPFILYLLVKSSQEKSSFNIEKPTVTAVMQRYWEIRVAHVRSRTFSADRFDGMTQDQVGQAKAVMASTVANKMLEVQGRRLSFSILMGLIADQWAGQRSIMRAVYKELVADGVLREAGGTEDTVRVSFLHDSFADFVMCKYIFEAGSWRSAVDRLLEHIGAPFYIPLVVRLVYQARDIGRYVIEDLVYDNMVAILERKGENQTMMNRSWGVTYALRDLAPVWFERMCADLGKPRLSESVTSSFASVLHVGHPLVVSTLIREMSRRLFKKRFIDSLGIIGDPMAVEPLLSLMERLLSTREDDELLETIATALGRIGDKRATSTLAALEMNNTVPRAARREARKALWSLTRRLQYAEDLPYTERETIEGLAIHSKRHRDRYSDWKMVKKTAERVASEARGGTFPSAAVVEGLIAALYHDHEEAQRGVVQALTAVAAQSAIEALVTKVLDSEAPDAIRKEIIESLAQVAAECGVDPNIRWDIYRTLVRVACEDPNPEVRRMADLVACQISTTPGSLQHLKE